MKKKVKLSMKNLLEQFELLKTEFKLDDKGDGIIETQNLMMFFNQINLLLTEEDYKSAVLQLDPANQGKINLLDLLEYLKSFIDKQGSKLELIEAFYTFDEGKTGKISLLNFRLIMKKYSKITDEQLDEMTLDIFEVKKLSQINQKGFVNYLDFCDKIFAVAK